MKRGSSGDAFVKLLAGIRRALPGVSLRTSFIVGFPGETEADFRELCAFVREVEFDWLGVFAYSDDETAESYALDGKLDPESIAERRDRLMAIQRRISARRLKERRGARLVAMLDGVSSESELVWEARHAGMAPEIDGKIYVTELALEEGEAAPQRGDLVELEITRTHDYDLEARVVEVISRGAGAVPALAEAGASPFRIVS
jgi:ribosomal protein S12 methylthiotransferase